MIRISFDVPNLNEAEFVLQAVRARLEEFRQPNGGRPVVQDVSVEVSPTVQPVVQTIVPTVADTPKKAPGRPKKQPEPVAAPEPSVAVEPEPVVAPAAAPAANIFDTPAATPAQAGRAPKDALNAIYTKVADAKGAGAAITATMGLLKEFGVSRVQDVPQDKWAAFDQRVAAMMAA